MRPPEWRTLVVDDQEPLRLLNRVLLESTGRFRVVGEAADGDEAVEAARRHRPSVVLLDLLMPRVDGRQALPHIRRALPDSVIIVQSMLTQPGLDDEVLELGADAFLDKGLSNEEFQARVVEFVTRRLRASSAAYARG